ncbi:MAG: hypothetical protein WD294_10605 [Phycisphaeraceae bacterium]
MPHDPVILFTAFEPSGDEHAAPVIAALLRRDPTLRIYAMGGPRMQAAGAELIETSTTRSVMGAGAASQALAHRARLKRLKKWVDAQPVALHVPTDSPAANWAICRMVKRRWAAAPGMGRVVHLVAPQVWAWASWRVRRLHKWSDHVLCLLPFEPDWFAAHNVAATFIGHPVFDSPPPSTGDLEAELPSGRPRLALLPGSRRDEVVRNWPVMQHVYEQLSARFPELTAVIPAADEPAEQVVRQSYAHDLPKNLTLIRGRMDDVVRASDVVLTVSGTATLHVAQHRKPMVVVYRVNGLTWHAIGRWLMNTGTFTLPNLVAGGGPHRDRARHIVPEFVPFLGSPAKAGPIIETLSDLLEDEAKREAQIASLDQVCRAFESHDAGERAADVILEILKPTAKTA